MDKAFIHGKMVGNMMEVTIWIKSRVMAFISGLMEENMKANG